MLPPLHNRRLVNVLSRAKYIPLFNTAAGQDASAGWSQQLLSQAYRTAPIEKLRRTADNAEADVRVDLKVSPPRITLDSAITVTSGSSDAVSLRDFVTPPEVQALYGERMYFDGVNDGVEIPHNASLNRNGGEVITRGKFIALGAGGAVPRVLVDKRTSVTSGIVLAINNGTGTAQLRVNNGFSDGLVNIADFKIYSYSLTFNNTNAVAVFYDTDGNVVDTVTVTLNTNDSTTPLSFGIKATGGSSFLPLLGTIWDTTWEIDGVVVSAYQGYGNTNADWLDTIGSNNGTVVGSPALFTGQGFGASFANLDDQTGNGATASQSTAASQPLIVEDGVLLEGPTFDGVDDFMESASTTAGAVTGSFSVIAKIRPDSVGTAQSFLSRRNFAGSDCEYDFSIQPDGSFRVFCSSSGDLTDYSLFSSPASSASSGNTSLVAFVWDGTTGQWFVDGSPAATTTTTVGSGFDGFAATSALLRFGARYTTESDFFSGLLDDIIIYDDAKSASEIAAIHAAI